MRLRGFVVSISVLAALGLPDRALAAFHIMEVEQVIGGVNGDTSAQAIQLKMRNAGQNVLANVITGVSVAQIVVRDAAGLNPVVLATFDLPNPVSGACRPILLATPGFAATSTPSVDSVARDYVMSPIPAGYLPAGSLTFETLGGGTTYWRVSWGGVLYTGPGTLNTTNDPDGNANPPFASPMPSSTLQALRYSPACPTAGTSNDLQYAVTPGTAVFTNNALANFNVSPPPQPPEVPVFPGSAGLALVVGLGALAVGAAVARRRLY